MLIKWNEDVEEVCSNLDLMDEISSERIFSNKIVRLKYSIKAQFRHIGISLVQFLHK